MPRRTLLVLSIVSCCALPLLALQSTWQPRDKGLGLGGAPTSKEWVQLESPQDLAITTAHPQTVTLTFRIQDGLHVNSHTPHSTYLIPTTLTLDAPAGLRVTGMEYPQARDYRFDFAPKDALSVYTGDLPIQIHLQARPGTYSVSAKLRYQACDNRMCNPPKTLLVTLHVTAK